MKKYMDENVFTVYPNSYVYVERTLENGSIREGLVGMVDLTPTTITPARPAPFAPLSAPLPSVSRRVRECAATRPSSCRTS